MSSSEDSNERGGAYNVYFDEVENIIGYKRLLSDTTEERNHGAHVNIT